MPDLLPPPGVDPSDWIAAQRQSRVADILMQQALSDPTPQQPAGGGKYYIAARTRPISALSKLAEAYMGRKAFERSANMQAQNYARAMQQFQGPSDTSSPAPTGPSQPGAPPAAAAPQRPAGPLAIPGLDPRTSMGLYMSKPEEYAKLRLGPDQVRLGQYAGMDPQSAASAAFNKQNALEARPGGVIRLPNGQEIRNPQLATGEVPIFDENNNIIGTRMLPGHIGNQAALQGAETAAKEANTPMKIPMGGGSEGFAYPGQVPGLGTPPAIRDQQGAAGPSNRSYFPQSGPPAPRPITPPPSRVAGTSADAAKLDNIPKLTVPNTPGQSTDTYHQKILEKAADKHIELADKYGSEADLADQRIAFNREALKVLSGSDTGPLSDELTKLRARALELGVPSSWIPGADTVGNTQELKKFLLRNPLLSFKPIFGRGAASEFQILKEDASPSPQMLKSTIKRLVELDSEQANYVKQRSMDYSQYHDRGGDPTRFESWYSNTHSFGRALQNYEKAATQPHTKEEVTDEMKKRGFLPNG